MNYLYALMGMAMLSGIISIMEIAFSINSRNIVNNNIEDKYFNSETSAAEVDRLLLNTLYTKVDSSWPKGIEFCRRIKVEALKSTSILNNYNVEEDSISDHKKFINTCTIVSSKHRIIISNEYSKDSNYRLFSCMTYKDNYCFYEK